MRILLSALVALTFILPAMPSVLAKENHVSNQIADGGFDPNDPTMRDQSTEKGSDDKDWYFRCVLKIEVRGRKEPLTRTNGQYVDKKKFPRLKDAQVQIVVQMKEWYRRIDRGPGKVVSVTCNGKLLWAKKS